MISHIGGETRPSGPWCNRCWRERVQILGEHCEWCREVKRAEGAFRVLAWLAPLLITLGLLLLGLRMAWGTHKRMAARAFDSHRAWMDLQVETRERIDRGEAALRADEEVKQ